MRIPRLLLPLATLVVTVLGTYGSVAFAASADTLANARDATAAYQNQASAAAAGYELLTDASSIACIDDPQMGAMGVHYVKGSLVGDGKIDPARPEALVYQVADDGSMKLVALEWVVIQSAWDESHTTPPTLFGQQFMLTPAGNRFGLPPFYSLHAWIYKNNPSGTFSPYNPGVTCGSQVTADGQSQPTAGDGQMTMAMAH